MLSDCIAGYIPSASSARTIPPVILWEKCTLIGHVLSFSIHMPVKTIPSSVFFSAEQRWLCVRVHAYTTENGARGCAREVEFIEFVAVAAVASAATAVGDLTW